MGRIFLNIVAVPILLSPPPPGSNVVVRSKESLIPGRLKEATVNKAVVLEIVLLRRIVYIMEKKRSRVVMSGIVNAAT